VKMSPNASTNVATCNEGTESEVASIDVVFDLRC
jgi:hypothetical protein